MAKLFAFPTKGMQKRSLDLKLLRSEYGLSLAQAAQALCMSVYDLEHLERGVSKKPFSVEDICRSYDLFIGMHPAEKDSNLLFSTMPLRTAREILGLTIIELAGTYNYLIEEWLEFEINAVLLPRTILRKIEKDIRKAQIL